MEEIRKLKRSKKIALLKEAKALEPITQAKAHAKYIRMAPRKVKVVLDLIRGEDIKKANAILRQTRRVATEPLLKLLDSATANAEFNHHLDKENLYVAECFVTEGPTLKRIRPVSKGRAHRIEKKTSHITVVLKERNQN